MWREGSAEVAGGRDSKGEGDKGEEEEAGAWETAVGRREKRARPRKGKRTGGDPEVQCARGRLQRCAALSVWRSSV